MFLVTLWQERTPGEPNALLPFEHSQGTLGASFSEAAIWTLEVWTETSQDLIALKNLFGMGKEEPEGPCNAPTWRGRSWLEPTWRDILGRGTFHDAQPWMPFQK